jgi:hypothetical protein
MSAGTWPPCSSTSIVAIPISDFDFCRKNPVETIIFSSSGVFAAASARASG